MKATIKQAEKNERDLSIEFNGYGHFKIGCEYKGKRIYTTSTDSEAVDNFKSEFGEKNHWGRNARKSGYVTLINEIIEANKKRNFIWK